MLPGDGDPTPPLSESLSSSLMRLLFTEGDSDLRQKANVSNYSPGLYQIKIKISKEVLKVGKS